MPQQHLTYVAPGDTAPAGAAKIEGNFTELYGRTLAAEDYGALGDGTTDDGPALSAAYTAANAMAVTSLGMNPVLIKLTPGKVYRIATTIIVKNYVAIDGSGATLQGPITGFDRISLANNPAVPAASDIAGQVAGACFYDNYPTGGGSIVYDHLAFRNLHLAGFRYGMVSTCLAWQVPIFQNVIWENCNVGFFAYQGSVQATFIGSGSTGGQAGTTFVAGATCFASGNAYTGLDNYFVDGTSYNIVSGIRDSVSHNSTFDAWFNSAIMRPTTPSVVVTGSITYPFTDGDILSVSGRNIFLPQRNNRAQYGLEIAGGSGIGGMYGFALLANPHVSYIGNIGGENLFYPLPSTATSGTGATATVSFAALAWAPKIGTYVNISGVTPAGYNGKYLITASTTTSVSYACTATGAQTVAGKVQFPSSTVMVPLTGVTGIQSLFESIDAANVTYDYTAAIEVRAPTSGLANPEATFIARRISGGITGTEYFSDYSLEGNVPFSATDVGMGPRTLDATQVNATPSWPGANVCVYFRLRHGGVISKVGFHTSTAAGNCAIAIYRNNITSTRNAPTRSTFNPGARVALSATTAIGAGYNEVSLGGNVTVRPGDWIAMSCDSATFAFAGVAAASGGYASPLCNGQLGFQNSAHPPPATPAYTAQFVNMIALNGVA